MDTVMFRSSAGPESTAALGEAHAARADALPPRGAKDRAAASASRRLERRGAGWYVTFIAIAIVLFAGIGIISGVDAIAASARFLWDALAMIANGLLRAFGGLLMLLAKGVGWRRLSRIGSAIAGIGLGYSGGVVLSERGLKRARTWTERLRLAGATLRRRWLALHLGWKLAIVAALIASQLYLHFLLILFPIAFLVPVVRRAWVQAADMLFGSWYWRTFGPTHRALVASLRRQPGVRHVVGGARLTRIRYLRAWRLWKYDPRYRDPQTGKHEVSFIEPARLWWRGELDGYVGRHLLRGGASTRPDVKP
jgi:hypothetical protein